MHINVEDYGFPLQPSLLKTNTSPFLENEIIDWFDSLYGCDIAIISNRFDNEKKRYYSYHFCRFVQIAYMYVYS